jgi:hypothetical protein
MRTVHRKPALNRNHTITFKQSDGNASRAYGQIWNVPSWHVPKVRGTSAKARRADLYLFRPRLHFDLLADLQPSPKLEPQPGFEGNGIMTHAIRFAIRFHETGGPEVLVWEKVDVGEPGRVKLVSGTRPSASTMLTLMCARARIRPPSQAALARRRPAWSRRSVRASLT